jgi:ABC-2 type transport system ATP-binding protein
MPTIEYKNVSLNYGKTLALDNISMRLEENKIYGLLGRNGAGKTSLLSLLAAFRRPTQGLVALDGTPVYESAPQMEQIALVWGKNYQDDPRRVSEVLSFHKGLRKNWDQTYAAKLIQKFGIDVRKRVGKLSTGMQAAVNLVIGLAARAPITIFDEAYLGVDAPHRKTFYQELLDDYMRFPRTFILSTHYISEVENLFEEIIILKNGKLLEQSDTQSFLSKGYAVTGNADAVDRFVSGRNVLGSQSLGKTRSDVVYGELDLEEKQAAQAEGLAFEQPSLQDMFIYLTEDNNDENK